MSAQTALLNQGPISSLPSTPEILPPAARLVRFHHHIISVCPSAQSNEKKILTAALNAVATWVDIASDRLGQHRIKRQNQGDSKSAPDKALETIFEDDKQYFNSYKTLAGLVKDDIRDTVANKTNIQRRILVLTDEQSRIQAIATVYVESQRLFVNTLMSAAWNIPMHAEIASEHKPLKVAGAGTTLMNLIYTMAQSYEKPAIQLKPLNGSFSYYQKLGMSSGFVDDGKEKAFLCTLQVQKESMPESLKGKTSAAI
jgi:hypothetical protein